MGRARYGTPRVVLGVSEDGAGDVGVQRLRALPTPANHGLPPRSALDVEAVLPPPHNGQGIPLLALAAVTPKASSQSSSVLSRTAQIRCFKLRRRPSTRHRRPPPLIRHRIAHDPAGLRTVALPDKPFTRAAMESTTPSRRRRPRPKQHRMDVRRPVVRVESPHVIMLVWHSDTMVLYP